MRYYLSLGANLGNREQTLRKAIELIEQQIGPVPRCSSFYYSEPWGFDSPNPFCNLCCLLISDKEPLEVLHLTQSIEQQLGRVHHTAQADRKKSETGNYSDRSIDIDLIRVFDQNHEVFWHDKELILPHPFWQQRDFVQIPLKELENNQSA